MLLFLNKRNCIASNDRQIYLNYDAILYFHAFSKMEDGGTELALHGGSVIHVRESVDDISKMIMTDGVNIICPGPKKSEKAEGKSAVTKEKRSTNGKKLNANWNEKANGHLS